MTRSKFSLQLLFLLFPFLVVAQGWERTYDGGGYDNVQCATNTLDGGVMMSSLLYYDNGDTLLYPTFFKTDIAGNLTGMYIDSLHATSYLGQIKDIVTTSDGNYVYALQQGSPFIDPINNIHYIIKITPDGNVIWEFPIPYSHFIDEISSMAATDDGGILILGGKEQAGIIKPSGLVKLDQNGTLIWEKIYFQAVTYATGVSVIEAMNNDIVVAGWYKPIPTETFVVITRLDEDGNFLWENEYDVDNTSWGRPEQMGELENGDIVFGGVD